MDMHSVVLFETHCFGFAGSDAASCHMLLTVPAKIPCANVVDARYVTATSTIIGSLEGKSSQKLTVQSIVASCATRNGPVHSLN